MSSPRGWRDRLPVALTAGICVLAIGLACVLAVGSARRSEAPWINHDVAINSLFGMKILEGDRLYVDFYDTNPPGPHFLHALLVATTDFLSAPDFVVHHLFVLLLGTCGLLVIGSAFRGELRSLTASLVGLAYLLVILRGNFSNNLFVGAEHLPYDFGQREHLFALLFLPYLVRRLLGRRSSPATIPWLLLLGFVSVFKPYWILFVVASEGFFWILRRERDLRSWMPLAVGMVLPYGILLVHSTESFLAFFTTVLPYHLGGSYGHFDASYSEFVGSTLHRQMLGGAFYFCAGWAVCWQRHRVERKVLWFLALLLLGAYLSVLHQHKFWSYHGMIFFALAMVVGTFLVARSVESMSSLVRRVAGFSMISIAVVAVSITLGSLGSMWISFPPLGNQVAPLVEGRERVMFFSMSVDYGYGALHQRVATVGPWTQHLELPVLLAIEDESERRQAMAAYAGRVRDRIDEKRPELLIFAPTRQALPSGTTLHGAMSEMGVVPRVGYRRWSRGEVEAVHPLLEDWIVYQLEGSPSIRSSDG